MLLRGFRRMLLTTQEETLLWLEARTYQCRAFRYAEECGRWRTVEEHLSRSPSNARRRTSGSLICCIRSP